MVWTEPCPGAGAYGEVRPEHDIPRVPTNGGDAATPVIRNVCAQAPQYAVRRAIKTPAHGRGHPLLIENAIKDRGSSQYRYLLTQFQ